MEFPDLDVCSEDEEEDTTPGDNGLPLGGSERSGESCTVVDQGSATSSAYQQQVQLIPRTRHSLISTGTWRMALAVAA